MIQKKSYLVKGLVPLFFLLIFAGCKKETSNIGVGLTIDGNINSLTAEFTDVSTRTVKDDSFYTDFLTRNILGSINDPIFGQSNASIIVQPRLTQTGNDFTGKTIDSIKLILKYNVDQVVGLDPYRVTYGDLESELELNVYKLNSTLYDTSRYKWNYMPELGDQVGSYTGKFNVNDSVTVISGDDTLTGTPELSITLDNSFGQELMDLGDVAYSSNEEFLKVLKGLVVVPNSSPISGSGAIVGVNTRSQISGLIVYYDDTLAKAIPLGTSSLGINLFETTPSGSISSQISGTGDFSTTYVQSMGGAKIKVDVSGLDSIIEMSNDILINEAKIDFQVDQSTITDDFGVPSRMLLMIPKEGNPDSSSIFTDLLDDLQPTNSGFVGYANYGGEYTNGGYNFHFNRYLQELIKEYKETGINKFDGFYLTVPADYPVTPTRAVIKSDAMSEDIKISITYTKLN